VHLFRFDGKEWYQQAYFEDPDAKDDVWFGVSVSLSADGNMLAVGSAGRTAAVESIGSIYLFQFDGSNWHQQALIQPSDVEIVRGFGHAVDLSADGKTLVVGAEWEYSGSTGINSIPTDDLAGSSGAAYVFRRNGDDWHQEAYIKPSNTEYLDLFGVSVSLSADGNSMAVGASGEDSIAIGIDDNSVESAGAVYLFRFDGADWYQQAYVKASNTGPDWGLGLYAYFGHSVSLSANGNALVVGAPGESSAATGVNGDQDDNRAQSAGAAYLFQFDGIDWHQEAYVKASNTGTWHRFGASVTLSGDARILAVGSSGENGAAVGINGDQMDGWAYHAGAVYIFRLDDTGWNQQAYVKASNTGGGEPMPPEQCDKHETCRWPGDAFGSSIALSETGRTMAVGAPGEDSAANGIDGDQEDNSAESAGAVYVY
jgi:hypothetical protein